MCFIEENYITIFISIGSKGMDDIIEDGIFDSTPLIEDWGHLENIVPQDSFKIDDVDAILRNIIPLDLAGLFTLF